MGVDEEPDRAELQEVLRRVLREELSGGILLHLDRSVGLLWPSTLKMAGGDDRFAQERQELLSEIKSMIHEQLGVVQCRFTVSEASSLHRLIVGGGDRESPLKDLRRWLKGARRLVIADPYFLQGAPAAWGWTTLSPARKKSRAIEYATEIRRVLGDVREVDVFHLPGPTKEVLAAVKTVAFKGRRTQLFSTTDIHDRVWIRDGSQARIVGTSFGTIGGKLAFMLDLPSEDTRAFKEALDFIRQETESRRRRGGDAG